MDLKRYYTPKIYVTKSIIMNNGDRELVDAFTVILASDFDKWLQGIKDKMLKERARFESQGRAEFKGAFYSMTKDVLLFYDRLIDRLEAKWNG